MNKIKMRPSFIAVTVSLVVVQYSATFSRFYAMTQMYTERLNLNTFNIFSYMKNNKQV